jgi:hypothetical protein
MVPLASHCATAASALATAFFAWEKQQPAAKDAAKANIRIPTKILLIRFFTSFQGYVKNQLP